MTQNQDPIAHIAEQIESKSNIKQQTYRKLCQTFKKMKEEAQSVVEQIKVRLTSKDEDITIEVISVSDQEFHIRLAGDLLVFLMHTNVVTLSSDHAFNKSDYVEEDGLRKYLGQINIYNFMADSITYNRLNDPGYLIARISLNFEKRFLVEGERQLNFMFDAVSSSPITDTDISVIIKLVLSQAIDTDLVSRPFPQIRTITLNEKIIKSQSMGSGYKIGFQLSQDSDIK